MSDIDVIVATCRRPRELAECLASLAAQTLPARAMIVVDDDPGGEATREIAARFRAVYVPGRRGGLADAHNRGLAHAASALVAFTDDDVVADPAWLERLAAAFGADERVACVTGRIVARSLETPAQALIDAHGGFDKGTARRVFDTGANRPAGRLFPFTPGAFGSGANMAFTRRFLLELGGFDPALGAGTRARGGDDLAAFFEVVQRGHQLVYEPAAVVHHAHPRNERAVERQVFGYGVGLGAFLAKCFLDRPRLLAAAARPPGALDHLEDKQATLSPRLRRRERLGILIGPFAYLASRRRVARSAA